MPRWVPLLVCQLAAWTCLMPAGWWLCGRRCDAPAVAVDPGLRDPTQVRRLSVPWVGPLLEAVEGGVQDALGSAAVNGELPSGLAAEVRALVAARLRATTRDPSADKQRGGTASADESRQTSAAGTAAAKGSCPLSPPRAPVDIKPTDQLSIAVLDGLGGRVSPFGPIAPNMSANAWGIPMPNVTVEVSPGKTLTVDEVVYGYDLVFEAMHLFSYVSWGRVAMQQDPADALVIADLLSRLQPDCFVELGTNTGGGAIFYAEVMKQYQKKPLVVTIDVHSPTKNWDKFAAKVCPHCVPVTCHPTWQEDGLIEFVQGYTQEDPVVAEVERLLKSRQCQRTVVMHDSDHRGFAVERDLQIYHRFVNIGSYLIVQDTKLSRMRGGRYQTMEAVHNFLKTPAGHGRFIVDRTFEYLLFSHHHSGFMQRVA